jgi:hypothetical protein
MKSKLLLLFLFSFSILRAQEFFKSIPVDQLPATENGKARTWTPTAYSAWQLNLSALSAAIQSAPMEFTTAAYYNNTSVVAIPQPDGRTEDFAIFKVQSCEQAIYDKHPEIRTFAGRSVSNPAKTIRGSITIRGFRLMINEEDKSTSFVEPYLEGNTTYYLAYRVSAVAKDLFPQGLSRGVAPNAPENTLPDVAALATTSGISERSAELVQLKKYRLAVSCTGEFGQDHGGTKEGAFAGIVEYANWTSSLFERDMALRLELVAGSEEVAYFDPVTDPFESTNPLYLLSRNGLVINGFIGINNYDVGHNFSRYDPATAGGILGVAGAIGNGCVQSNKADGVSTGFKNIDYGGNFVNTIGQEIGHQLGGGHTWNRCAGGNGRNGASAFEPGSGSTIMSYGGACGSDNIQSDSDLYFHAGSIEEITAYYTFFFGATCGTFTETTNHRPEVQLPYTNDFFIPIKTPFELDGSATDEDGDVISYCWEQMNTGPETPLQTPVGNSPLFRTFPPNDKTNRYFPALGTVLSNTFDETEQLPTYSRDMDFRLSARDNRPSDGGTNWADVSFRATDLAGPFVVMQPNVAAVSWKSGEYADVKWDVSNTFAAPVSCKKVNIRLSTDGGLTWPTTLAAGVTNDGEHTISVPNIATTKARIRVDAADNIFYDVSNFNFKIEAPTQPSFTAAMSENSGTLCLPNTFTAEVLTAAVLGFSNTATIEIIGGNLPPTATASLSKTTVQPGQSSTLTVNMSNVTQAGTFTFDIKVSAAGATDVIFPVTITTITNDFSTMALQSPSDGSSDLVQSQVLRWTKAADAESYNLQLSTSASFAPGTIVATKSNTQVDTFKIPFLLEKSKAYFWRIRPNNACSPHAWTEPYFFSTLTESCANFGPADLPKSIAPGISSVIESKTELLSNTIITDINIKQLKGFHGEFSDLDVRLISPAGTEVTLFKSKCQGYNGVFDLAIDDSAPTSFVCPPSNLGNSYVRPQTPLAAFIGQSAQGIWTLRLKDVLAGEGGTLEALQFDICQSVEVNPPTIVTNNILGLDNGTNKVVSSDYLLINDIDNTSDQLVLTLLTVPYHGYLAKDGFALVQGDKFTQSDIDNGIIRYYNDGTGATSDYFRFVVSDGNGGFYGTPTFLIQITVDAPELAANNYAFRLLPNPAQDAVWITLEQPVMDDLSILVYNTSGQLVRSEVIARGNTRHQITMTTLPRGMYFVQASGKDGVRVEKLMLK